MIRLRVYYYYNLSRANFLWTAIYGALRDAREEGLLVEYPPGAEDHVWIRLPETDLQIVDDSYLEKMPIWDRYVFAAGASGTFLEQLLRLALRDESYAVAPTPTVFTWNELGALQELEVDVLTLYPHRLGITVKNKLSEVYSDPMSLKRQNEEAEEIQRHFEHAAQWDLVPVLVAPLIDGSFYLLQDAYEGLQGQFLFQFLRPEYADLAADVRRLFRFGHIVVPASETEVPEVIRRWVRRIPVLIERARERHRRYQEFMNERLADERGDE